MILILFKHSIFLTLFNILWNGEYHYVYTIMTVSSSENIYEDIEFEFYMTKLKMACSVRILRNGWITILFVGIKNVEWIVCKW